MAEYNGHPSWNAWNVSLWIGNDEPLYRFAMNCIERSGRNLVKATNIFMASMGGERTPDGARYTGRSVKHALAGLMED